MALISLLTDFGLRDEYAGVMKGVIASIHPNARVIDVTHDIDPQDVVHGAFILAAAYRFFPAGSVHVAVVDPGVGGTRRIVAAEIGGHRFLAPDNGLLERVLVGGQPTILVAVENRRFFLDAVSRTFHGRDIFAPVAARMAAGLATETLGPALDRRDLVSGVVPRCRFVADACVEGTVVAVDRFGNLLTTIDAAAVARLAAHWSADTLVVDVGGTCIGPIAATYDQVAVHTPLAIMGSRGLLEISVNCGNAHRRLGVGKADHVCLRAPAFRWKPPTRHRNQS